jgi:signal transduction histidine kinase
MPPRWASGGSQARRAPPWWPEGEPWPPAGGGWSHARFRRFRRRAIFIAFAVLTAVIAVGIAIGMTVGAHHASPDDRHRYGLAGLLFAGAFVALIAGVATAIAYRRIGAPTGELLAAARQVGAGERDVHVEPRGPRELRALMETFNRMAASLRAAEDQRRRFLADVTHELRTPLAVLQSSIEAQLDGIHPRDDAHLRSLLEETELLGRLIEDLATLALADAGRLTLHPEPVDPRALADDAVEAAAPLAEHKSVALRVEAADALPPLEADPTRLRQVLVNLLTNAIRHSPAGGAVTVVVDTDRNAVSFTVRDTGRGIPGDQLDAVFDRFTKAADSGGSGLGLAIARDLVRAHGGTIAAANRPDGGAAVTFTIPVASPADQRTALARSSTPRSSTPRASS